MPTRSHASNGARLVSVTGTDLPLRDVAISSVAAGGIVRSTLRQHFANTHALPLELTYTFPLPADGAVAGYEVRAGRRTIKGSVARRDEARASFDAARLEGRTAGLLEQERPNLFIQHLGNIPAATDVIVELTIDHRLVWIPGGTWEWRFPTVVAPRYLGAEGRVDDANRVVVDVVNGSTDPTASVTLTIGDSLSSAPTSPTHPFAVSDQTVSLAGDVRLDRDIVVRWSSPAQSPGCTLRTARPGPIGADGEDVAYGLLTLVPPAVQSETLPRDLVLLLDVSGSMDGAPLQHLKNVVTMLVDSLHDNDRLEMIAFSSDATRYGHEPVHVSDAERRKARRWIQDLRAGGGTEMIGAIDEALRPLRGDVVRQVVIVTDGLIGFESSAVRAIRDRLPHGSRLHAVGIGSASNRAFLQPAARAGRGIEVLIDLDEPADRGADRILAATREPVVTGLTVRGTALLDAPPTLPDLLAGSPVLAVVRLRPSGGEIIVRGSSAWGPWEERLVAHPVEAGDGSGTIPALWAREAIADLELDLACGGGRQDIDRRIEQIALEHSVSSRLTSWVAIAEEPSVDPREPVRVERIPQAMPYGMSAEGLGIPLRSSRVAPAMRLSQPWASLVEEPSALLSALRSTREETEETIGMAFSRVEPLGKSRIRLSGRIMTTPGRPTSTIEFLVSSVLDWEPPATARIAGRDVDIIRDGTTRPGTVAAGSMIRVELRIAPDAVGAFGDVEIDCGPNLLIIEVDGAA